MYDKSKSYHVFLIFNFTFLSFVSLMCILPLVHILAVSFSDKAAAGANLVTFFPIGWTLDAWKETIANDNFLISFWNGIVRTILGTVLTMIVIVCAAYSLSKEEHEFKGRKFFIVFFVIIMLFRGGLIPEYMLIQNIGLMNTIWALIFHNMINVFNMILLLNFFRTGIPKQLEESAYIDGSSHFKTLWYVYLPLSKPALATISLFTMVFQWNEWFDGLIFLTDSSKYPLSTFLQTVIVQMDFSRLNVNPEELKSFSERTVRSAQIFIGAIPVLLVYPFLQKYFVNGIVLGAIKE